jgi:pimeloyl-ACP methyl ester carboxylesterase
MSTGCSKEPSRVGAVRSSRAALAVALVAGLVAGLVAAGCTGQRDGPDPDPRPEPGGTVAWEPCPELLDELIGDLAPAQLIDQLAQRVSYECATLAVPRDWAAPGSGEHFDVALVRARHTGQQDRIGSVVVNPGGPGASGVESAVFLSFGPALGGLPDQVTSRFDVVGFDPRGVARSSPVECYPDQDLDQGFGAEPDPVEQEEFDEAVADTRRLAEACGGKYGETLGYFSTTQTARDLDAIRAALGEEKLTYLGFSYGTLLGSVYAQLYPDHVRALVLDGAVDPRQDAVESSKAQAEGFERALDNFAGWCDRAPDECPIGPGSRAAVTGAIDDARRSPVPGEGDRDATAGWVFWAVVATLYVRDLWPRLGAALEQLDNGDPSGVFELADTYTQRDADGTYTNMFEASNAVNCADQDTEVTLEQVRDLQSQWREEYPLFGAPLATGLLGCLLWPATGAEPYPTGPAPGAPPILVVGTVGDPATPYESAPRLAGMLGVGRVLTWEGEGHTAYPGTECVNQAVDSYLIDLTVPDEGATCPPE